MADERVNTFCAPHCGQHPCEFQATVKDGRVVRLDIHPKMRYPPCPKGWTNISRLYHPDRLMYPMRRVGERGKGEWERISWDEALDTVARKLNESKAKYGNESVVMYHYVGMHGHPGGCAGMRSTALRLFNLWGGCIPAYERGSLCMQALISACNHLFGNRNFALPPDNECRLIIIVGSNPAETRVRGVMQSLLDAKEKGTRFVVIDPVFTATAAKLADEYLPIRPGTDAALALAIFNLIIKEGIYNKDIVTNHTNAPFLVRDDTGEFLRESDVIEAGSSKYMVWDTLTNRTETYDKAGVRPALSGSYMSGAIKVKPAWQKIADITKEWTPQKAAAVTGIPAETIERLAREFATARSVKITFISSPAVNRASWGENTVYAFYALNAITGNFRGCLPIMDPRVPGVDVGLEATIRSPKVEIENPVRKRIPVNHLAEAILNPARYDTNIKTLFVMLGNPVSQNADSNKTIKALMELDFIVVCDIFMSATARYADILLPVNTFLERTMILETAEVSVANWWLLYWDASIKKQLFFAEKAVESLGESKSDFEIVCALARKMGYGQYFPWKDAEAWIKDILNMAKEDPRFPWLKPVTLDRLKREGIVDIDMPVSKPSWELKTPSGRIEMYNETLLKRGYDPFPVYREPEEGAVSTPELFEKYPLTMVSPHTIWRAHSSYANQPELMEAYSQDVLMNPDDAARRGIKDGEKVLVFNDRGRIEVKSRISEEIKPGVVRICEGGWHEHGMVNLLTSDRLTTYGENPTYNTCLVEVKKTGKPSH